MGALCSACYARRSPLGKVWRWKSVFLSFRRKDGSLPGGPETFGLLPQGGEVRMTRMMMMITITMKMVMFLVFRCVGGLPGLLWGLRGLGVAASCKGASQRRSPCWERWGFDILEKMIASPWHKHWGIFLGGSYMNLANLKMIMIRLIGWRSGNDEQSSERKQEKSDEQMVGHPQSDQQW